MDTDISRSKFLLQESGLMEDAAPGAKYDRKDWSVWPPAGITSAQEEVGSTRKVKLRALAMAVRV